MERANQVTDERELFEFNENHPFVQTFHELQKCIFPYDVKKVALLYGQLDKTLEDIFQRTLKQVLTLNKDEDSLYNNFYRKSLDEYSKKFKREVFSEIKIPFYDFSIPKRPFHKGQLEDDFVKWVNKFKSIKPKYDMDNAPKKDSFNIKVLPTDQLYAEVNRRCQENPEELIHSTFLKRHIDNILWEALQDDKKVNISDLTATFEELGVFDFLETNEEINFKSAKSKAELISGVFKCNVDTVESYLSRLKENNQDDKTPRSSIIRRLKDKFPKKE